MRNLKSELVKEIHEKVNLVKKDKTMKVEYMTLLERDREKIVKVTGLSKADIEKLK